MDERDTNKNDEDISFEDLGMPIEDVGIPLTDEIEEDASDDKDLGDNYQIEDETTPFDKEDSISIEETEPEEDLINGSSPEELSLDSFDSQSPIDIIITKIDDTNQKMDSLKKDFLDKIKYDSHKEKIIDELHKELQIYKDDIVKKHLHPVIMDVIKIIDDIRKMTNHYLIETPSKNNYMRILDFLEGTSSDLEDLIATYGVADFKGNEEDFNPNRHRVVKMVETGDIAKDKTIARRLRPGYELDGKVIRPEMVAVYSYSKGKDKRDSNE